MAAMASADPVWERFVTSKLSQAPSIVSQHSENSSILGARSINLTSGSIALHADAGTAALMRDLAVKPVSEILSGKASQELASRNRYVDFVRLVLSCCVADASGREKKADVVVKALQAIHSGLVVDKPAHELQNVLLTELDDINPDRVPLIADAILAPLLAASRRQGDPFATGRPNQPPAASMGDIAAAGFLVALDTLPKVLGLTAGVPALSEEAPVPEDCRGLSGAQYKERVVSRLFRARWPGAVSIGLCQVLRDLDLEEGQLKVAVARVLRHLHKSAKLHDLPPLTYQLLLLAGRKCKEAALEGVIRVFDRLDAAAEAADREDAAATDDHIPMRRGSRLGASSTQELRLVEGTILLHFNFAMKQDHNLASCVLKGFQRRATAPEVGRAFTPFRLALLLSLSRIQRFSQPVLDLVQDIVSDSLMYDHLREDSAWLEGEEQLVRLGRRSGSGGGSGGSTNRSRTETDEDGSDGEVGGGGGGGRGGAFGGIALAPSAKVVENVLLTVVRSSRGWDHLVGSLLKLGMQLLDRGGAVPAGVPVAAGATKGMLEKLQGSHSHRASLRASHLGRVILMETFKTHEIVRRQVLTSVLEQVTARSQGVMGYVKLLGLLAERSPNLLLDDAEAVRDVFGYISILPPPVSERFLLAVAPLLRLRPRLQDSVVLPLRKALFSREERARLVAVGGLVLLLGIQSRNAGDGRRGAGMHGGTQLSQSSQASQGWSSASLPSAAAGTGGGGRALSLAEGFGLLRRCLTQQMVVRAKLYDGLLASFVRGSLEFQLDTISLLAGHLRRFVNFAAAAEGSGGSGSGAGGGPPLLLTRCLDPSTGDMAEPLPLLIGCLHRMVVLGRASLAEHGNSSDGGRADPDSMLDDDVGGQGCVGAAATTAGMALLESLDELDGDLRRLSTALSGAALEDFGLDKVSDFSPAGGPAARAKLATAALLCGSYEAFMQGSLLLMARPANGAAATAAVPPRRRPNAASLRALLGLFDCRQALLELVRPGLPTPAQQRAKKSASAGASGSGGINGSVGGSLGGDGESAGGAGGGAAGSGPGQPGFSALGCFGLTLHPGGMPCLGMAFVEDMLAVLNVEPEEGDGGEETEGDTECDPGVVDVDARDPSTDAVREDIGLQRLVLETCRGHLRSLRTSTAAATAGLMVEIGGSCSAKGAASASAAANGIHGGPQDEADAAKAGKAAVKRCTGLVPLLLKEVFRQLAEGNNSGEAKAAAAAMKASDANGSKGKAKSGSGAAGGGGRSKKKSGRTSAPAESLSELALACFEECVCVAAHCSPRARAGASRTGKILAAAYKHVSGSNAPSADPAGAAGVASVIGKHAGALVQTLTTLIADNQAKEAETVCRILSQLARPLKLENECLEAYAASLKLVCREQRVNSPVLAKAVVSLYVQAHMSIKAKDGNLSALHDLATQVRACLGLLEEGEEEEEDEPPALSFRIINNYTVASISEVTVGAIEACIDDVEYALRLMHKASLARQARVAAQTPEGLLSSFRHGGGAGCSQSDGTVSEGGLSSDGSLGVDRNSDSDSDAAGVRSDGSSGERDPLDRRETVVCDRLRVVMQTITVLAGTRLEGRSLEKLVSSASRVFRAITKVLKVRLSLKRAYVGLGLKSVLVSKQEFTKALHSLLPHLEDEKGSKVTKHNITRQSRLVPALIFQMEECDVQLLLLGKLCKGSLDLPRWVSSRVDRDFRIDQSAIAGCQEHSRGLREKRKRKAGSSSASKKKSGAQARKDKATEDGSEGEGGEGEGDKDEDDDEGGGGGENGDEEEDDDEEDDGDGEEGEEEEEG